MLTTHILATVKFDEKNSSGKIRVHENYVGFRNRQRLEENSIFHSGTVLKVFKIMNLKEKFKASMIRRKPLYLLKRFRILYVNSVGLTMNLKLTKIHQNLI